MIAVINIVLIAMLLLVIFQDLKQRAIHVSLPVIICGLAIAKFKLAAYPLQELLTTSIFLGIIIFGLFIYVSVKSKKIVNSIDSSIGLGDIVFFVAIIPLFFSTSYVLFFITGMLISIFGHIFFNKRKDLHVPLAGYLSMYLIALLVLNTFTTNELFYTHYLL